MYEPLTVFTNGDRFATMSTRSKFRVYQVDSDGCVRVQSSPADEFDEVAEPNFWDDRTTPDAYGKTDADREKALRDRAERLAAAVRMLAEWYGLPDVADLIDMGHLKDGDLDG